MSFVTAIRDYVETLNTISTTLGDQFTPMNLVSETGILFLKTLQNALIYLLSFQWIRDFTLLPIVLPQISLSIFRENFFLETPSKVFFDFLEIPDLHQNKFLLGFFNSFFLSLPISIVHILAIRRLFIQGIPSGVYSIGGYLTGQIIFLSLTLFGCRQILIPWFTLEPLNYLLGVVLIFRIIYSMTRENLVPLKGWVNPQYSNFFITCFILAWCEETSIFQYLGNLTLSSNVTLLETFSSSSSISSFLTHSIYICGIVFGSAFFTIFWGFVFLQIKNLCLAYTPLFLASFLQLINKTTFILALALSLTSIPFYGFDYLVTGPLGFVSQDNLFKNTILGQNRLKDFERIGLLSSPESGFKFIDFDVAPFDRGEYLKPEEAPLGFEELNYRGENDWITRNSKVSTITYSKSGLLSLGKIFKKDKKNLTETATGVNTQTELNRLLLQQDDTFDITEPENQNDVGQRFLELYGVPETEKDNFLVPYKEIYQTSFSPYYIQGKTQPEKQIEEIIKQKYYANPVFKTLLAADIDLFLKRQPQDFQLTSSQELDLYEKRQILENYYNSLRAYSNLPFTETFDSFFNGAKSFSNKVYNQQFKGTLRSVTRLFTIQLDSNSENPESIRKILKFDQPLYNFSEQTFFSPYHEELGNQVSSSSQSSGLWEQDNRLKSKDILMKPLYAGWDENMRKFVITNKYLPRTVAGYKVALDTDTRGQFSKELTKQGQKIRFTAWPLATDSKQLLPNKETSDIPYVALYQPVDETTAGAFGSEQFTTLPANVEKWQLNQKRNQKGTEQILEEPMLTPKRGGFIWPGNSAPKFPFFSF